MSIVADTQELFGPDGLLAKQLPGYEERPPQRQMAEAVAQAILEERRLVIEAATGTGKTVAYLIPALLSGKKVVVSTATKNLQEQIFLKDIPFLQRLLPRPFRAVYLKGRQNYLCHWQYESFLVAPRYRRREDAHWWPAIQAWVGGTRTGDRAEIAELPDDYPTWSELSIGADSCLGRECAHHAECFVNRAREDASTADVIVVNHHLLFADLALKRREAGGLLPPFDVLVLDEAHNLEETAANFFGLQVSNYRVADLLGDVLRFLAREAEIPDELRRVLSQTRKDAETFFERLGESISESEGRIDLGTVLEGPGADRLNEAWQATGRSLADLRARIQGVAKAGEVGVRLAARAAELGGELAVLMDRSSDELVYMVERRGRGVFATAVPIDLRSVFQETLFRACKAQIYTSATLTTDGNFRFFQKRLGLPAETSMIRLEPVFDYMKQALLFVPEDLPEPSDPFFIEKVAPTMRALLELCEGRAFLLFTSHRNMRRAWELLAPGLAHKVLVQGQMGRTALLEEFRRDTHSILFATSSFWEGVDVQGESLSLVIIDKLPFASPGDPLVQARVRQIQGSGGNAFFDYQVPGAVIALKQGFGRLIRHRNDTGIIAILDSRLVKRSYGRRFLESLPRARRTKDFEVVELWWTTRGDYSSSSKSSSGSSSVSS